MMGLNDAGQSYFVGVAPDGGASPQQAVDRATGPANPNAAGAPRTRLLLSIKYLKRVLRLLTQQKCFRRWCHAAAPGIAACS